MINQFGPLVMAVLGVYIIYKRFSEHVQINKDLKQLDAEKRYMKIDNTGMVQLYYGIGCILATIGLVVGVYMKDYVILTLAFVLACMSAAELLTMKSHHRLYYNKSGFILNGKVIRYKSIKNILPPGKFGGATRKIETYGGESYKLPKKYANVIEQMKNKKYDEE